MSNSPSAFRSYFYHNPTNTQKVPSQHAVLFLRLSINILLSKVFGRANQKTLSNRHPAWLPEPLPVPWTSWDWSVWWLIWSQKGRTREMLSQSPMSNWHSSIKTDRDTVPLLLPPALSPETWGNSTLAPHSMQAEVAEREIQALVPKNRQQGISIICN